MTENEITSLMLRLADMGVTGIKINYDGSGDSGAIEEIVYSTRPYKSLEELDEEDTYSSDFEPLVSLDSGINDLISDFADERLNDIEDWWNNEGGYGTLSMLVPSGKYIISNNIRITHVETYFHEDNLLENRSDV